MAERLFRIHPGIGIARVGNAEVTDAEGFFIGPETPGIPANFDLATGRFRDFKIGGAVKRQAARFRVWEYEVRNGKTFPLREIVIGENDVVDVQWSVTLANRKASFFQFDGPRGEADEFAGRPRRNQRDGETEDARRQRLEMEASATRNGASAPWITLANPNASIPIDELGRIRTDEAGRLLVAGGKGQSATTSPPPGSLPTYANNDDWFDDVADGPVAASVLVRAPNGDVVPVPADPAWVVSAPPDFGPAVPSIVTLHDTVRDVFVRLVAIPGDAGIFDGYGPDGKLGLKKLRDQKAGWQHDKLLTHLPSFVEDVWPVCRAAFAIRWVHEPASTKHNSVAPTKWAALSKSAGPAGARTFVFNFLRDPDSAVRRADAMPRARGDDPYGAPPKPQAELSLTRVQYALLRRWAAGAFEDGPTTEPPRPSAELVTPEGLDRAALEAAVGGAFYPGIEASWLIRNPKAWSEPYRLKPGAMIGPVEVRAGFVTQQLAVPWQADFNDCKHESDQLPNGRTVLFAWWPSQRPDDVFVRAETVMRAWRRDLGGTPSERHAMVAGWATRGFVVEDGSRLVELEGPP